MTTVTAEDAQRDFATLLKKVEAGETLVITDGGRAVAEVKPVAEGGGTQRRPLGFARGLFTVPDSFFDPLPEEDLRLWEGRGEGDDEAAA